MTSIPLADELNLIDEPSVLHTLRVTLATIGACALAISAFTLLLRWSLTPQLALVASASSVVALVLSRSGRIRLAIMLPLLTITYAVLHSAVRSDGIQSIGLTILPVLIMVGSLVLDRPALVFFTASIILAVVGMLAIRYFVLLAERYSTNDMGDLFIFAITCATAALVGRLFALRIKDGFGRAQVYCQALRAAERNVRMVADSLSEMVVAYDSDKNLTYANSGAEKLTGYGFAELRAAAPLSWTHPEDRPQVLALWHKVFDGQMVDQVMYRLVTKDGTVKWVAGSWGPVTDEVGRHVGIRGTCQDITERVVAERLLEETKQKFRTIVEEIAERKRAEAALRESEARFQNMANTAPVMIWISGPDKLCTFFNKGWLDFTGRSMEQELGNGWARGVHPGDVDRCLATYSSSFDARLSFQMEYRLQRADGEYRWVLDTALPLYREGEFAGYIGSCIDVTDQKLVEARLRASEIRLLDAQRLAKVGSWERDLEAGTIHWSDEMSRIFGLSNDAPSNFPAFLGYVHPNDREKILEADAQSRSSTAPVEVEYRIIRHGGEVRFVRSIVEAIRNDHGAPVRIAGATQDISEQVKARELLRASEQRLKNAERLAHVGNWHWDIPANRITWSEEMFRIFGKPQDYTPNYDGFFQSLIPQDRERVERAIRDGLAGKGEYSLEFQITLPDGGVRTIATIAEVLDSEEGLPTRMFGACQDITERKQAEELLRKSEERLKTAERLAHVGNWEWDIKTDRLVWSEEVCRIFGRHKNYTTDYAGFLQAVQPYDRQRVVQCVRDRMGGKAANILEFQITRPDGDVRTVSSIAEVVRDERGLPVRMTGAWQDITDQKRAEAALRRSLDEVAHLNRVAAMGELTASLAHEMNQPLAAILSNAQAGSRFLRWEPPDLARVHECLTDIAADTKRAGEVINRLRGLLKKGEPQPALVDLNEVVSDALRLMASDALRRQASVKFEPFPGLLPVHGDRIQLYQVVLNLIMNGLEAAAEHPDDERWVLVRTAQGDSGGVQLTVEDSGKGIAKSDLARVFEPFFSTKRDGLGIGLSISRSIVQAHGGRIWAERSAGHGAVFHCMLPVAQQGAAAATI